jgi:hypothetical protein
MVAMNKQIFFRLIAVISIIGLLAGACGAPPATSYPTQPPALAETPNSLNDVTLQPVNLVALNPGLVAQMVPLREDLSTITAQNLDLMGGVIRFSDLKVTEFPYAAGDIMAAEASTTLPFGLLRKVTSVQESAFGGIEVQTVQAKLEEAIPQGDFSADSTMLVTSLNPEIIRSAGGGLMRVAPSHEKGKIKFDLKDVVLWDEDNDHGTTNDQVIAKGWIEVTPDFYLHMKISKFTMEEFTFTDNTSITADIKIQSGITLKKNMNVSVFDRDFPNINIPTGIPAVPAIILTPKLDITIGLDGQVSAGISTGSTYTHKSNTTADWKSSTQWSFTKNPNEDFKFTPPTFQTKATAKLYARPRLRLMLFGVVGPYTQVEGYVRLEASPQKDPWWVVYGGVSGRIGIEFELFGFLKSGSYCQDFSLYDEIVIASAPLAVEPPAEIPATEEPQATAPPEEPNPPGGNDNPPESSSAVALGNENVQLVYDNSSAHMINMSQDYIKVNGVIFNRIDDQGNITASYAADMWGNFYKGYDTVPPNYCLRIALPKSSSSSNCTRYVNFETSQEKYYFWRATSDSRQFQVWKNGTLLQTCEISAGSCYFYLP